MSWSYRQDKGMMFKPDGTLLYADGYAGGNKGQNPEGINNPLMQFVKDVGPLPQGKYTMGTPVEGTQLGKLAIPLYADLGNDMGGREGFYIHGDLVDGPPLSASDGCIIAPHDARVTMAASDDKVVEVYVE